MPNYWPSGTVGPAGPAGATGATGPAGPSTLIGGLYQNSAFPSTYKVFPFDSNSQNSDLPVNPQHANGSPISVSGTLSDFYIVTNSPQDAGGDLQLIVLINGVDTAIVATVPAGSAAGLWHDTTHSAAVVAGDYVSIKINNLAPASNSAQVSNFSIRIH